MLTYCAFCSQYSYKVEVLRGQQIELVHSICNLEYQEYYLKDFIFSYLFPQNLQKT